MSTPTKHEHPNGRWGCFLTVSVAAGMTQSGRVAPFKQGWDLTDVCRPGRRPDVAFVEPLILELNHTIETR